MAKKPIFITLAFLSLLSLSSSAPSQTLLNAAETLANSGFVAMSLTLELISETLIPQAIPSTTIFSPPDYAFSASGQPSLSLLQLHFSPISLSLESLRSLPFGTKIPTLCPGKSLIVTTLPSEYQISLNNVTISGSPIYDDGSVIVYGIEKFFDQNFTVSTPIRSSNSDFQFVVSMLSSKTWFYDVSGVLRSRGYSVMASFLDLQLLGFFENRRLTVFAPVDEVMVEYSSDFPEYSSLFLRHVVPCRVTWTDMVGLGNGTVLGTYLEGFSVNVTRSESGDALMINGVSVTFPDMYYSDWLVVHGVREILLLPQVAEPFDYIGGSEESISSDHGEF